MKRIGGQGSIEFLLVFLGFAALFLGLFEITRLYRCKHVLNTATFAAVRAGALHHASTGVMNAELANGMVPLLMQSTRSALQLGVSRERALALIRTPGIGIQILSPTRTTFAQFRAMQWVRLAEDRDFRWQHVIPNDNLRLRSRAAGNVERSYPTGRMTVQDANLLRVTSLWCHRLITPVLDRVVFYVVNWGLLNAERQRVCSAISGLRGHGVPEGFYVAVVGDAVVRMQSSFSASTLHTSEQRD